MNAYQELIKAKTF